MQMETAMGEMAIKTTVPANHRITITVPDDLDEGDEVEVVVRPLNGHSTGRRDRILAALSRIAAAQHGPEPTKEELDREIQAQRDSWD